MKSCLALIIGMSPRDNVQMPTPHRKTCKRYDVPGDAHFLTFSCFKRLPLLNRDRSRGWMIEAIALAKTKAPFDLWAYVVMPEHVHLVLFPASGARISAILKTMKQSVSKRALNWLKKNSPEFLSQIEDIQPNGARSYRFWQRGGGYDRNLRSVRDIHEKIRYVHQNRRATGTGPIIALDRGKSGHTRKTILKHSSILSRV